LRNPILVNNLRTSENLIRRDFNTHETSRKSTDILKYLPETKKPSVLCDQRNFGIHLSAIINEGVY